MVKPLTVTVMTPSQLVKAVSVALDVPEETVAQHDRNLLVAGLRTKSGRGRSAPRVITLDAARLLVATLASFRTKDSVATLKQFEQAIFEPPEQPQHISFAGTKLRVGGDLDDAAHVDTAILRLPQNHNIIDALAAIIDDASQPIVDLQSHLKRFSNLGVSCSYPSGRAKIGDVTFVSYSPAHEIHESASQEAWGAQKYYASGIRQERIAPGAVIMLLGSAFRDDGLRYANAGEAYRAGFGTRAD
jgi:hypothetical protein